MNIALPITERPADHHGTIDLPVRAAWCRIQDLRRPGSSRPGTKMDFQTVSQPIIRGEPLAKRRPILPLRILSKPQRIHSPGGQVRTVIGVKAIGFARLKSANVS